MAAPTIAVLTDGFGTGVGSPARANTPTGATTGAYGTPQSSWGVGNGWIDIKGNAANQAQGWNIASTYATSTYAGGNYLMQDPNLTQTPNQGIQAAFVNVQNTNTPAYGVMVRGVPNTDSYVAYYSSGAFALVRASGGNLTGNALSGGAQSATVTVTPGHNITVKLTCTGDGATTSALTAVLTDTTTSTVLATLNGTDTFAELQSGGRVGIYTNLASGSVQVSQAIVFSDTALPFTRIPILFVGDSMTYSLSTTLAATGDIFCRILNARSLTTQYFPVNMGFSGATAALWAPGNGSGYFAAAVQNANAVGATKCLLMLGANDAVINATPAATWFAGMQTLINGLKAQIGVSITVNFPPYFDYVRYNFAFGAGVVTSLPLLRSYLPYLSQLQGITVGDTLANQTFQNVDYYGLTDGGHSNDQACPVLVSLWLNATFPGLPANTKYPDSVPISNLATGTAYVTIPWTIPATGVPGSTGFQQNGTTSYAVPVIGTSAQALCNVMDGLVSSGKAQII